MEMTPLDLDAWEAEAKEMQKQLEAPGIYAPNCDRILALISELRQAREHLNQTLSDLILYEKRLASAEEALNEISHAQHFEVLKNEPECIARFKALKEQGDKARAHFEKWGLDKC